MARITITTIEGVRHSKPAPELLSKNTKIGKTKPLDTWFDRVVEWFNQLRKESDD